MSPNERIQLLEAIIDCNGVSYRSSKPPPLHRITLRMSWKGVDTVLLERSTVLLKRDMELLRKRLPDCTFNNSTTAGR